MLDKPKLLDELTNKLIDRSARAKKQKPDSLEHMRLVAQMDVYKTLIDKLESGHYEYGAAELEEAVHDFETYIQKGR